MADPASRRHSIRVVVAFIGLMLALMGLGMVEDGNRHAARIDPEVRCAGAETLNCFTVRIGTVRRVDGDDVVFAYEGESETHTAVLPGGGSPLRRGSRIRVERWNDDVVSLYARGRRSVTSDWPRRWDPIGFGWSIFGAAIMLIALLPSAWSRYQAARSNGKP
jgi:hypothetical protein